MNRIKIKIKSNRSKQKAKCASYGSRGENMAKKGLFGKIVIGSEKSEDYARSTLPTSRTELFGDVFKTNFLKLVGINLMTFVTFIPILLILLFNSGAHTTGGALQSFNQPFGIGYPAIPALKGIAENVVLSADATTLIWLPFAMILAGLGISGSCYVIRNMTWGEGVMVVNDYFRGIKKNYFVVTATSIIYSIFLIGLILLKDYARLFMVIQPEIKWLFVISEVLSYFFMFFITVMAIYMISMGVTYKLKYRYLIKNAFLFTLGAFPLNLVIALLSAVPAVTLFIGNIFTVIFYVFVLSFGISTFILLWTVYTQWIFDRYINVQLSEKDRNRGIYKKPDGTDEAEKYKQQKIIATKLTSRPIKPIDDDIVIDELPTNFTRADLEKLNRQKQEMIEDEKRYEAEHYEDERYAKAREEIKKQEEDLKAETKKSEDLKEEVKNDLLGKKAKKNKK